MDMSKRDLAFLIARYIMGNAGVQKGLLRARSEKNLQVVTSVNVIQILFKDKKAVGVSFKTRNNKVKKYLLEKK